MSYADFAKNYKPDTRPLYEQEHREKIRMHASVGITVKTWEKLDRMKNETNRSKLAIVDEALNEYFDRRENDGCSDDTE